MLKLGFHRKDQISRKSLRGFWGKRRFVALDLYDQFQDVPAADRDFYQERILGRFSVGNRTFKCTFTNRFELFDDETLRFVQKFFSASAGLNVHDIGVSDGRTAAGFYKRLHAIFDERLNFLASDYMPYLYVVQERQKPARVIVDSHWSAMQIVYPPFVFNVVHPENPLYYPVNYLARKLAMRWFAIPLMKRLDSNDPAVSKRELLLASSACQDCMFGPGRFAFEQYDILSEPKTGFDLVRAMNLLNTGYFDKGRLAKAVRNVFLALNEGGLFVTGSNRERGTTVDGSIFVREKGRFSLLYTSGTGSIVESIARDMTADS